MAPRSYTRFSGQIQADRHGLCRCQRAVIFCAKHRNWSLLSERRRRTRCHHSSEVLPSFLTQAHAALPTYRDGSGLHSIFRIQIQPNDDSMSRSRRRSSPPQASCHRFAPSASDIDVSADDAAALSCRAADHAGNTAVEQGICADRIGEHIGCTSHCPAR